MSPEQIVSRLKLEYGLSVCKLVQLGNGDNVFGKISRCEAHVALAHILATDMDEYRKPSPPPPKTEPEETLRQFGRVKKIKSDGTE